jgi:ariadne-1
VRGIALNADCPENAGSFYEAIFYDVQVVDGSDDTPVDDDIVLPTPTLVELKAIITIDELRQIEAATVDNLAETLLLTRDCAWLLLVELRWRPDAILQQFGANPGATLALIGLKSGAGTVGLRRPRRGRHTCGICWDEIDAEQAYALPCGHVFCASCWADALSPRGHVRRCPQSECLCRALLADVLTVCGPEKRDEFESDVLDFHIETSPQYRRCSRPTCGLILTYCAVGLCQVAVCRCRQRVCWRCGGNAHSPLSCRLLARW